MTRRVSFRDPGGSVSVSKDRVVRTILPEGQANLRACLDSSVARRFVDSGSLINTVPIDETTVEHPRIPFASYPHEWPAVMLHAAAQLTLDLSSALLDEGKGLKDATPANILFRGPRPVFVDVLSFEDRDPHDVIWLADAQFTRTFLIPLLLHRRTRCAVHEFFLTHRDGIPPEDAVRRLPAPRRWLPPDLGLVTIPSRAARFESEGLYRPRRTRDADQARFVLSHHFHSLRRKLHALTPRRHSSAWSNYEAACPSYTKEQHAIKRGFVEQTIQEIHPAKVIDVGANNGEFSFIAAEAGASVVSIDSDPETMGALWRSANTAGADILPLVVDFARPTPSTGWRCQENAGFLERAEGYFDCALALAVTHHLMVTDRIPLPAIFETLADLTTLWLIIEYVGPQDPMFRRLARGRDALFSQYSRRAFDECASQVFEVVKSVDIPSSERALYLLRRKS